MGTATNGLVTRQAFGLATKTKGLLIGDRFQLFELLVTSRTHRETPVPDITARAVSLVHKRRRNYQSLSLSLELQMPYST